MKRFSGFGGGGLEFFELGGPTGEAAVDLGDVAALAEHGGHDAGGFADLDRRLADGGEPGVGGGEFLFGGLAVLEEVVGPSG